MSGSDLALANFMGHELRIAPRVRRKVEEKFEYGGRQYRTVTSPTNGAYPTGSIRRDLQVQDGYFLAIFSLRLFPRYADVTQQMVDTGKVPIAAVQVALGK